jgi:hypothetical protein
MKQFVPLTDELLYESPDAISGPLVPFDVDYACLHWLAVELLPPEEQEEVLVDAH